MTAETVSATPAVPVSASVPVPATGPVQEPVSLAFAPAPAPQRRRHLFVGTGFATAGVLIYFATLFGIYLSERADFLATADGQSWIPSSADLQLTAPSMIFWTLLLSIVTMQWAVHAAARQDRRHLLLAVVVTGLFGVAIINQMAFIFVQMELAIDGGSQAAPLIYAICGSFVALVAANLVFLAIMALRSLSGQAAGGTTGAAAGAATADAGEQGQTARPSATADALAAVALSWYAMVFVYVILWVAIFIAK